MTIKRYYDKYWNDPDRAAPVLDIGALVPQRKKLLRKCFASTVSRLRVLEVGCGDGVFMDDIISLGHDVYGVDIAWMGVNKASSRLSNNKLLVAEADVGLPYMDSVFDVVYSKEVIEHILDIDVYLKRDEMRVEDRWAFVSDNSLSRND